MKTINHGLRWQVINAVINRSQLWKNFKGCSLTENMRVLRNENDERHAHFVKWLLDLGERKIETLNEETDFIELPRENCLPICAENSRSLEYYENSDQFFLP